MIDPEKLLQEMTPEEYENLTGQKKPAELGKPMALLVVPSTPQFSEPIEDDELAKCGGDSAELHD
jgi:hypothetical protein